VARPAGRAGGARLASAAARRQAAAATPADPETIPSSLLVERVAAIHQHLQTLAAALPILPDESERARIILSLEFEEHGLGSVLLLILAFAALGFGAEWLFYWAAAGVEKGIIGLPLATVGERLRAVAVRLAYGTGMVGPSQSAAWAHSSS
jgi:hypothetical protein